MESVHFIQAMVAPAVMISACGLLLLGMNNKYSLVVNRVRLLNAEMRESSLNEERAMCIKKQIPYLKKRMRLIRNAVWFYTVSVIFFVISMLIIGASFLWGGKVFYPVIISFVTGVVFIILGSVNAAEETRLGYKIVSNIELKKNFG